MKKKVAVVVPFYHNNLSKTEQISFQQCLKILGSYPIILLVPDKMEEEYYSGFDGVVWKKVPDIWLDSIQSYNRMMLSKEFYECFESYEYILIYQLDAFVFFDQLEWFCDLRYDYIGAPWLYGARYYLNSEQCVWYVGNGGLSLRKVSASIRLLEECKTMLNDYTMNEDLFFSMGKSSTYKVAPVEIALKFSFEQEVERCFYKNNEKMPFGCHAWERYNLAFWKPYIEQYGYVLDETVDDGEDDKLLADDYKENERYSNFMINKYQKNKLPLLLEELFDDKKDGYAIWGAGFYGREVYAFFEDAKVKVDCILDNNYKIQNDYFYNHIIMSLEEYSKEKRKSGIIIALKKYYREVAEQLEKSGYKYKKDYIFLKDLVDKLIEN